MYMHMCLVSYLGIILCCVFCLRICLYKYVCASFAYTRIHQRFPDSHIWTFEHAFPVTRDFAIGAIDTVNPHRTKTTQAVLQQLLMSCGVIIVVCHIRSCH